uniref:C2H2-type domain-containing protein n=1 Tax=Ditylenchus dipsaci TaxID=166011 RepID=A0A915EE58_9BILA
MEMEVHQGNSQLSQTTYHHPQHSHHHILVNHHHAHHNTILPIINSSSGSSNLAHFEPKDQHNNSRVVVNKSSFEQHQASCSVSSSCSTSPVAQVAEGDTARGLLGVSPNKIPTCTSPVVSSASRMAYFDHSHQQIFDGILQENGHQSPASESSSSQQNSVLKHLNEMGASSLSSLGRSLSNDRKRPYPCNLCSSKFGSKMELEEHQNSHTGMKPFQCDICQSRFNRRSTLWNHKRIHNDAKPFVCNICTMTFKWKNSLKCHKEMHLRKNETDSVQDTDIRLLTYATAAKKRLGEFQCEMSDENTTSTANSINSASVMFSSTTRKRPPPRSHKSFAKNSMFSTADSKLPQLEGLGHQPNEPISVIFSPKAAKAIKLEDLPSDTAALLEGSGLLLNSTEEFIRQQFSENGGFDVSMLPSSHSPSVLSSHAAGLLSSPNVHNCSSKQLQQQCGLDNNNQSISTSNFLNATRARSERQQPQQTDLFSQLDHEHSKMPNFLDQSGCASALNMRLPFLNFDLQQLNNSLVEQQTHHLQHSSSAFDSFNNLQHQQIQQHCGAGGTSFNIPTSFSSSTNASTSMSNHSSAEMLLGGSLSYPLDSCALLSAAAAAANASSTNNSELGVADYFSDYTSVTSTDNSNSYSQNINSIIHHQQQLNTNHGIGPLDSHLSNNNLLIAQPNSEDPLTSLMMHPSHHNYLNY